jgi:hypothetical protein
MVAKKYFTEEEKRAAKNAQRRERYASDPEYRTRVRARIDAARLANPEAAAEQRRNWAAANREKVRAIKRRWNSKNREYFARRNATEEGRAYKRRWMAERLRNSLHYRLAAACRDRLRKCLRSKKRAGKTLSLLGCTPAELRLHLESRFQPGMSWENWAYDGWHIDHIRPLASFDLADPEQQKIAFHYTNLQPLWATDNLRKGARREVAQCSA